MVEGIAIKHWMVISLDASFISNTLAHLITLDIFWIIGNMDHSSFQIIKITVSSATSCFLPFVNNIFSSNLSREINVYKTVNLLCHIINKLHWRRGSLCISCQITFYILFYHPETTFHQKISSSKISSWLSKYMTK